MRARTLTRVTAALVVLGAAGWLGADLLGGSSPERTEVSTPTVGDRSEALARTRLGADLAALDAFVAEQRARAEAADRADEHRVLAEAHLERCLLRDTRRGMAVGEPTHAELPAPNQADIEAGLAATDRAIERGDPSADVHRIRSALLSLRVTGFASALANRPKIDAALKAAEAIDPGHPRVVIARACEKLFAPNRLLGHDPAAAERMFVAAAAALPLDERPLTFAAMCAWLLERNEDAIEHLGAAAARNPQNPYVREVLRRLEAGEDEPFARDV
jgi:hypothetical protein